jgi:hypothetical protein
MGGINTTFPVRFFHSLCSLPFVSTATRVVERTGGPEAADHQCYLHKNLCIWWYYEISISIHSQRLRPLTIKTIRSFLFRGNSAKRGIKTTTFEFLLWSELIRTIRYIFFSTKEVYIDEKSGAEHVILFHEILYYVFFYAILAANTGSVCTLRTVLVKHIHLLYVSRVSVGMSYLSVVTIGDMYQISYTNLLGKMSGGP